MFGFIIPVAVFFGALWQNHPDPSNFRLGELFSLRFSFSEDEFVYECPESGEVFPLEKIPHNRIDVDPADRHAYERFLEQSIVRREGFSVRVVNFLLAGVIMTAAGVCLSARKRHV